MQIKDRTKGNKRDMQKKYFKISYIQDKYFFPIVMIGSFFFRLYYICFISIFDMQHDVGQPGENYGHLGYISYLLVNHHLPDFDVREAFQFWHPPFHHAITALFLKLVWFLFPSQTGNYESIQILPLFYVSLSLWIIWKMLHMWEVKQKGRNIVFFLMAFHPTFIILSGSVNNDTLCVMLSLLALYLALLWYRNPKIKTILAAAIVVGVGMSTKATTVIIAFPMAFLFLMGLFKYRKKVVFQLILFGVVSLPLGLWWYLRNYFLFEVPINYIYWTSTDSIGYLGNIPLKERILDFNLKHFSFQNIYVQFEGKYIESNPIIALLKTSVYGQYWFNYNIYIRAVVYPLVFLWTLFVILSLLAIPSFVGKVRGMLTESWSIILLYIVQFISYYSFCLQYPFVWTMDIRYAVPLLLCHGLLLAEFLNNYPKWENIIKYTVFIFNFITCLGFFLLSFTSFS